MFGRYRCRVELKSPVGGLAINLESSDINTSVAAMMDTLLNQLAGAS